MQWVMLEHLKNGQHLIGRFSEHSEGVLRAASVYAIQPGSAQSILEIRGEAEGNQFRDRQRTALTTLISPAIDKVELSTTHLSECNTEIDMHQLSGALIDQDIGTMSIPDS